MLFLFLTNANFQFSAGKLTWKPYNFAAVLPITSQMKLIDKKEFAKIALDKNLKTFVVYISALEVTEGPAIHPSRLARIATL